MRDRLPMILSTTALVVAVLAATPLGEAAYEAVAPGSVGTAQLKNHSITAQKLRKGSVTNAKLRGDAVTSGKVKNRSLRAIDFKQGQLPAGPPGPPGPRGAKGEKGEAGATSIVVRRGNVVTPPDGGSRYQGSIAECQRGERVTGGGAGPLIGGFTTAVEVSHSQPYPHNSDSPTGWSAHLQVRSAPTRLIQAAAFVLCAKP